MTTTTDDILIEYEGDGSTVGFATDFPFLDAVDLVVTVAGVAQTLGSNYSVTGGGGSTGSVVFATAPDDEAEIVIRRSVALTQTLDLTTNDAFQANSLERALDRLTYIAQQLKHSLLRTLRFADTAAEATVLPDISTLLSKFLYVNSSGAVVGADGTPSDPLTVREWESTATAGQQVFNLEHAYTPGSGQLAVHIGVTVSGVPGLLKQVAGVHYTETDSDTITFTSPLAAGTLVQFTLGSVREVTLLQPLTRHRAYTLTEGQTTVTSDISYTPDNNEIIAFLNGAHLELGVDLIETSSTLFTFGAGVTIAANDRLTVYYGQGFDPADLSITQSDLGEILYPRTTPEINAGVTPVQYHYPPGDDRRYAAYGDGVANDRAALQASIDQWVAGGSTPRWRRRTYNVGSLTAAGYALRINAGARGFLEAGGAKLVTSTGDTSITTILQVADCADITIRDLYGVDSTYSGATSSGAVLVDVVATAASDAELGNITLEGVVAEGCNSFLRVRGDVAGTASTNQGNRIRGIHLGAGCKAEACAYGVQAQNHGDFITGRIECDDVRTATNLHGVIGFDLDIYSRAARGSSDHVGIYAYDRSTGKGRIRLCLDTPQATPVPFAIGFQNTTQDESITDLDLDFRSAGFPTSAPVLRFRALDAASGTRTTTDNLLDNVRLTGAWQDQTAPILVSTTPNTEGRIVLAPSLNRGMDVADPEVPGFVIMQGDAEVRVKKGDLTASPMFVIPLARYDGAAFALEVTLYAQANSGTASSNHVIAQHIIHGYNASGGAVTVSAATAQFTYSNGTAPTINYTASGENINVTISGTTTGYNNSASTARLTVRKLARFA